MEWISVKDRLPEDGHLYLVYDDINERIGIREFNRTYFMSIDSDGEDGLYTGSITHWMPLPELPEA